jgi:cell wall-associated NlpC family hydrolase
MATASAEAGTEAGDTALRFAYAQLGKRYQHGAAGPDAYDCSGLTMAAWGAAGVGLPHSAAGQYRQVQLVDRAALRPGDLIFYRGLAHVAIYAGNGMIIDAPKPNKTVTIRKMDIMSIVGYGAPVPR